MSTEIREAGYQTIRDFIESDWDYIELRDDDDSQVTRIQISEDDLAQWVHASDAQVLEVEVEVQGEDDDIPLDTTFTGSALYNEESGGDELSFDDFSSALIGSEGDILIVTHEIEVPQL